MITVASTDHFLDKFTESTRSYPRKMWNFNPATHIICSKCTFISTLDLQLSILTRATALVIKYAVILLVGIYRVTLGAYLRSVASCKSTASFQTNFLKGYLKEPWECRKEGSMDFAND